MPDALLGELVVACVVPHANAQIDEEAVRSFARKQLASFKVPRRVLFLSEQDISQTGSAKVKTAGLRALVTQHLGMETA